MIPADYEKILVALAAASHVLSNQGELSPADLRIRCLVNITAKEAKRALLEANVGARSRAAAQPESAPVVSGSSAP